LGPFSAIVPQKYPDFSVTICTSLWLLGNQVCVGILLYVLLVGLVGDHAQQISDDGQSCNKPLTM